MRTRGRNSRRRTVTEARTKASECAPVFVIRAAIGGLSKAGFFVVVVYWAVVDQSGGGRTRVFLFGRLVVKRSGEAGR